MKHSHRITVGITFLIIVVVATACGNGPTYPFTDYEVVQQDFTVPAGGFLREAVHCPDGKVVLGGGAKVIGEGTSDFKTVIRESVGGTTEAGTIYVWLVALHNSDNISHTVGIFAVCATNNPAVSEYEIVKQEFSVPAGGFLRDAAECPSGKVVLGGGAQVVGEGTKDFKTVLRESVGGTIGGGAQDLWLAALQNDDNASHTVGIFAICAANHSTIPNYQVVQQDFTLPAGGFLRETAECPAGTVVMGGGAQVVGEGKKDFQTVIRESSNGTIGGGAQDLWLVALQNNDNASHKIGILAFCAEIP